MGTGNYSHNEGSTIMLDLFDGITLENEDGEEDEDLYQIQCDDAREDLRDCIKESVSKLWFFPKRTWRKDSRDCLIIACNRMHEIWTHEDSYGHVFVTFGIREDLGEGHYLGGSTNTLAEATYAARAEAFFDKLQEHFPKHTYVATSAWTSTLRTPTTQATGTHKAAA